MKIVEMKKKMLLLLKIINKYLKFYLKFNIFLLYLMILIKN